MGLLTIVDVLAKIIASIGVLIAAFSYYRQVRIKHAEWLNSLFEKFFENQCYKEVRGWLDYDELDQKLKTQNDNIKRENEEKFTDFLNFFEFIGVLYFRKELNLEEVNNVFDYYLLKIKNDINCQEWINKYGFEKLRNLIAKI
jgi:hypothetical protein